MPLAQSSENARLLNWATARERDGNGTLVTYDGHVVLNSSPVKLATQPTNGIIFKPIPQQTLLLSFAPGHDYDTPEIYPYLVTHTCPGSTLEATLAHIANAFLATPEGKVITHISRQFNYSGFTLIPTPLLNRYGVQQIEPLDYPTLTVYHMHNFYPTPSPISAV
jgi:hypothetical protein